MAKSFMDMSTELRKAIKNDNEKDLTNEKRRNCLGSKPNYHTRKCFHKNR